MRAGSTHRPSSAEVDKDSLKRIAAAKSTAALAVEAARRTSMATAMTLLDPGPLGAGASANNGTSAAAAASMDRASMLG